MLIKNTNVYSILNYGIRICCYSVVLYVCEKSPPPPPPPTPHTHTTPIFVLILHFQFIRFQNYDQAAKKSGVEGGGGSCLQAHVDTS